MGTQADMHAARQREMAVVLARGIEPVRAFELVRVEIARGVEDADPIAGLDLDPVPFEVALHLASRIDERLSAQEFLDRRIDEPLVLPDLRLKLGVHREAAEDRKSTRLNSSH